MFQMTLKMSLPVALGEGSEPLSQADRNVTYQCQEAHIFTESSEKISVRPHYFFCTFPFGYFLSILKSMKFDYNDAYWLIMLLLHRS